MDVLDAIHHRRSVRKYRPVPIPHEVLTELVDAAMWAPYGTGKAYPLRFVVVTDADRRSAIRDLTGDPDWHAFVAEAPAVVAVLRDTRIAGGDADAHAATQNLLLAAYECGLGTCWIGSFSKDRLREVLALPEVVTPVCLVTVGYADERPTPPPRPPVEQIMMSERWPKG